MKDDISKRDEDYLRIHKNLDFLINEVIPYMEQNSHLIEFDAYECTTIDIAGGCQTYRCLLGWYTHMRYGNTVEGMGYEHYINLADKQESTSIFSEDPDETFIREWSKHEFGKYVPLQVFGAREEGNLLYRKNELIEYVEWLRVTANAV